ncbi:MAG: redoxin domain-containing protein [Bacteroidales bacterium]|nr:redoxin domain-containing protein [Bacteroidales bacterium]
MKLQLIKKALLLFGLIGISYFMFAQPTEAEDFTVTDTEGVTYNLFEILDQGKYVYLDFWFSTCGGCQGAVPGVNDIYEGFGCNEFELIVLGIGSEDSDAIAEQFREDFGCVYPLVSGQGGSYPVINYYGVEYYPEFIVISPDRSVSWDGEAGDLHEISAIVALGPNQNACPDDWPVAAFTGAPLILPVGSGVTYHDESINNVSQWLWFFEGGEPETFNGQNPPEIIYNESGWYDVSLTVQNAFGNENSVTYQNYVQVFDIADDTVVAYFSANQVVVVAGYSIDYTDLSHDFPYEWHWAFEGAVPNTSTEQHPQDVVYNNTGTFNAQLIVRNSVGWDTLLIENYITVIPDAGLEAPVANFTSRNRLVKRNIPVYFDDLSTKYPMSWSWQFEGGDPQYSGFQIQPEGVIYANTGFFDVTLSVSNINGSNVLTKRDYIVVYETNVGSFCDTIGNLAEDEIPNELYINGMTGCLGGQNSDNIKMYADYYDFHTFNQVHGVIVPVMDISYGSYNSYIRFITWDGADNKPTTILSEQKVYLHNLSGNFIQVILFDEPLEVDGPFYLGYSINYADGDKFVVGMSPNRGNGGLNTFWVKDGDEWKSTVEAYDIAVSSGIRPLTCLVGIEDEEIEKNISLYPNPCSNYLTITNGYTFDKGDFVEIFDKTGRTILMKFAESGADEILLDVSQLSSGVYFTRVFTQGKLIVDKLNVIR